MLCHQGILAIQPVPSSKRNILIVELKIIQLVQVVSSTLMTHKAFTKL